MHVDNAVWSVGKRRIMLSNLLIILKHSLIKHLILFKRILIIKFLLLRYKMVWLSCTSYGSNPPRLVGALGIVLLGPSAEIARTMYYHIFHGCCHINEHSQFEIVQLKFPVKYISNKKSIRLRLDAQSRISSSVSSSVTICPSGTLPPDVLVSYLWNINNLIYGVFVLK